MRELTAAEIERLASRAGVKRIAVENFLSTLYPPAGYAGNLANANADARCYRWSEATLRAIRDGIFQAWVRR
jgi:hypothetical protein